jgi:hypothetical protein
MRADECLFMGEQRSCSGHRRNDHFRPTLCENVLLDVILAL